MLRAIGAGDHGMLDRLAGRAGPEMSDTLARVIEDAKGSIDLGELVKALETGHYETAVRIMNLHRLGGEAMLQLDEPLRHVLATAGKAAADSLAASLGQEVTFDANAPGVTSWASRKAVDLSRWLPDSAEKAARGIIDRQLVNGNLTADETAKMLRDHLGIPDKTSQDIEARIGELVGEGVTKAGALAHGAETARIATQERVAEFGEGQAFQAGTEGQRQAWRQGVEQGVLPRNVRRYWVDREDDRVCPICQGLHGQSAGLEEAFTSTYNGKRVMNPGEAHPVGCRCGAVLVGVG
jgi:hypothetical protein